MPFRNNQKIYYRVTSKFAGDFFRLRYKPFRYKRTLLYNEIKTIIQAIDDVRNLDIEKEIIVIDNCSTDGTRELLRSRGNGSFKVFYQDRNYGFGKSIDKGI